MTRAVRSFAAFILTVVLLQACTIGAFAGVVAEATSQTTVRLSPEPTTTIHNLAGSTATGTDFAVSSYQNLIETVARQLVARVGSFTVRFTASLAEVQNKLKYNTHLWDDIFKVDLPDTVADLDYLKHNMSNLGLKWSYSGSSAVCTFTQTFLTTAAQESYVSTAVGTILDSLDIEDSSVYGKIKAVHDYIVNNVEYDYTYSRYSAYNALYSHSTVCQGYALLTYRLLLEAGVPVRFISGEATASGSTGAHAWNIVKIGQYWYNMDITWDDAKGSLEYFLKNNAGFSDHYRDSEYKTSTFNTTYPMSPVDFSLSQDVKTVSSVSLVKPAGTVFNVGDTLTLSAAVSPADATNKNLSWSSSNTGVARVDSAGYVTLVGEGTSVITVSTTDGSGKSAMVTLSVCMPDVPSPWAADGIHALSARGVVPVELLSTYKQGISRAEFMALIANIYEHARGPGMVQGSMPFTDIAQCDYRNQIALCYSLGIINGVDETLFAPDMTLTRQQCAKIICNMIQEINGLPITSSVTLPYGDMAQIDDWALPFVRYAYEYQLMMGTGVNFEPDGILTREQAMILAERMMTRYGW